MTGPLRQLIALTAVHLSSLSTRIGTSLVIVIGIAGVICVLLSVLAVASGFGRAMENSGRADRAVILHAGAPAELASVLPIDKLQAITNAVAAARVDVKGEPLLSAETMSMVTVSERDSDDEVSIVLRGVGPKFMSVHPELHVTRGRMFHPGLSEAIVGRGASSQFADLGIGNQVAMYGKIWQIVGVFESQRDPRESELLTDSETLMSATGSRAYQSLTALMQSAGSYDAFKASLSDNPTFEVDVYRERDYLANQSEYVNRILFIVAYVIGGIMAVGAVFAAVNSMYSAVSTRARDIATLRALGFAPQAVVGAVMVEALLLAIIGSLVGGVLAWAAFNGHAVSTAIGGGLPTQVVFELAVDWRSFMVCLGIGSLIGLLGGLLPAVHAARVPVVETLRAV